MSIFLGRVVGIILRFLRAALPYAWKVVVFVTKTMTVTLIATFRGWGPVARQIAQEMTDEVLRHFLLPISYARALYLFFLAVAYVTLALGWIFLSFFTVFLVRLIF